MPSRLDQADYPVHPLLVTVPIGAFIAAVAVFVNFLWRQVSYPNEQAVAGGAPGRV